MRVVCGDCACPGRAGDATLVAPRTTTRSTNARHHPGPRPTALAVVLRWPGQFAGAVAEEHILTEALVRGTALSPPLPAVLGLALAVWLGTRRHIVSIVGCSAVVLLSMVVVVNGLAVAMAPITHGVPRVALVLAGTTSAVLAGVTIVAAVQRSLAAGH